MASKPSDAPKPPGQQLRDARNAVLDTDGDGEFFCEDCNRRCTRGPSGTEYGHARGNERGADVEDCPRRPDSLDPTSWSATGGDRS